MKTWCKPDSEDNPAKYFAAHIHWQEKVILAAIVSVFLVLEVRAAALRSLWFDEFSTWTVASAPTIKGLFRALSSDGNPPLYPLLAHYCLHLPIYLEIALRLPSIIAINITALMIYLFVRRNTGAIFAFLAMSVFIASSYAHFYAIEARSYALLLCFTSFAICCWQAAARGINRRLALAGIAASMAGAIFTHHYGVIYVTLPLAAGECVRTWQRRRIDFPVFAAMLAGAASLIITIPPMLHGQAGLLKMLKSHPVYWARPALQSLWAYFQAVPNLTSILVFIALIFGAFLSHAAFGANRVSKQRVYPATRVRIEDLAAGSALALILPVMLLVTKFGTGYFPARYAIGSSLGVAIVSGLLMSLWNERWPEIKAFIAVGVIYCFFSALPVFWPVGADSEVARVQTDPVFLSTPAQEPIVIADARVFWPTWWYSDSSTRVRLHYLSDLCYALEQPDPIAEYTLILEQPYGAPKLDNYTEFLASHREFFLYCTGIPSREWVKNRLDSDGWRLTPIASSGVKVLYRVSRP